MNWDDLRIVAAVRDEGTYAGASARLKIDETTVARRLARMQRALGFPLFEAIDGERRATPQCEAVLDHVRAMATHVTEIGKIGAAAAGPVGRLRIASTGMIVEDVLGPDLGPFLEQHSGIALQFLISGENVDLARWEADLAIRLRKPAKGNFAITKLGELRFCLVEPAAAAAPIVCAYPDDLDHTPESQFMQAKGLKAQARCVSTNLHVVRQLVAGYRAAGVLPEHMCKELAADRRLRVSLLPKQRDVWLLVQNHLRHDPAARITIDWIRGCFRRFLSN